MRLAASGTAMKIRRRHGWLGIVLCALTMPAWAVGILIPAAAPTDMVHDDARGRIYIADGDRLLRYDLATGSFLAPVVLGGKLGTVDMSPSQKTLVATDWTANRLVLLDLDTLQASSVVTPNVCCYEYATHAAAYGADGRIYVATRLPPGWSGTSRIRRFGPAAGNWTDITPVVSGTVVVASGDRQAIAFSSGNRSDGPWGLIDVPTGLALRREWDKGTGAFNAYIGVDAHGLHFSLPNYGGTLVYNDTFAKIATLGPAAGVVYHPVEPRVYYPWRDTRNVEVYDTGTMAHVATQVLDDTFTSNGGSPYSVGHARISRDGSLLMALVPGGLRIYRQYGDLRAKPLALHVEGDRSHSITLVGSIGNRGSLAYSIVVPPTHGTATLAGNIATYTPAPGYSGADAFVFKVTYGLAERRATVSLIVDNVRMAPTAGAVRGR